MAIKAPASNDTNLSELMNDVRLGKIQLPEFQRGWTWDDNRLKGIIASLSQGYPMGAIMRLQYGNDEIRFKYRPIEGIKVQNVEPDYLVLDGQQRLTSIFRSTVSPDPVETKTEKGKEIKRFYYLDINKCLDEDVDRVEAIYSVPDSRQIRTMFDRNIELDLSSRELEYANEKFPLNIVFDSSERENWADGYKEYYRYAPEYMEKYKKFRIDVLDTITSYKLPVITLDKSTPREAVCKVFENVNTGGVPLTVFELVTAMFATYEFDLRKDWEVCRETIWGNKEPLNTDVMQGVDETSFLTAVTLYTTYLSPTMTTCKKKDVLALRFEDYENNKKALLEGYKLARKFLLNQYVFRQRDLPYSSQIVPLAAICAVIGKTIFDQPKTQKILSQWFWCGILGEMYGGANETRFANDIEDVINSIQGEQSLQRTINSSFFSATRLISLQTRNSAAYKGIMALVYREQCRDFVKGTTMDIVRSMEESPDIHHIFPEAYCQEKKYKKEKWNSIVNKTPLLPESNRSIGGAAPSIYCRKIKQVADIDDEVLKERVESHLIDYDALVADDFDGYFVDRAKRILKVIESAMGKSIADKNAEQTIQLFGCALDENVTNLNVAPDEEKSAVEEATPEASSSRQAILDPWVKKIEEFVGEKLYKGKNSTYTTKDHAKGFVFHYSRAKQQLDHRHYWTYYNRTPLPFIAESKEKYFIFICVDDDKAMVYTVNELEECLPLLSTSVNQKNGQIEHWNITFRFYNDGHIAQRLQAEDREITVTQKCLSNATSFLK